MESKNLLKIFVGLIVLVALVGGYFFFLSPMFENDNMSTPEGAIVVEYTGNDENNLVLKHQAVDLRHKTREDSKYIYYVDKGTNSTYSLRGYFKANLTKNNINGSSKDLKAIRSEFKQIKNNTHLSYLDSKNLFYSSDNLSYSSFDGNNAYLIFYKENGDVFSTKRLDEFFFACSFNPFVDNYTYSIQFGNDDVRDMGSIISNNNLKETVDLCMIFNSTDGQYEFRVPLEYSTFEDEKNKYV